MCKSHWIKALVLATLLSTPATGQSGVSSNCEVRSAMSAGCPCVWAAMIFNLSPDFRQAVVEEKSRTIMPRIGEWGNAVEMLVQLEPWERSYVGCRIIPEDGPGGSCSVEYSWVIVSCNPIKDQS